MKIVYFIPADKIQEMNDELEREKIMVEQVNIIIISFNYLLS